MASASSADAVQLTRTPRHSTEPMARIVPNVRASPGLTRPRGMGRAAVRAMRASMSASNHMLSAPDAPAPTAMQSSAAKAITGCIVPGAIRSPTKAVKTASAMTRGFISAM